jgi:phage terminase large subunit GpA-like protein
VLRGILEACSDPAVRTVVVQKSAQIGYTVGVVCNVMGYYIHHKPSVQVVVFPRLQAAKDFAAEKFDPMVRATPVLAPLVILKSRALGNSQTRKRFPGGLAKLVGGNSPSDVKSTSARLVIIEEPDDVSADVRGQGGSIKLAKERSKTYPDHLILIGGTPTAKGASAIEAEMAVTDQRRCWVPCVHCDESHVLAWDHVVIPEDADGPAHEVYGRHRWQDAHYVCPHCGSLWSDDERIAALHRSQWIASATGAAAVGFYTSELNSTFDDSRIPVLARKFLEAQHKLDQGEPGDMIAFWNSTLGLPWEYKGELPEEDELEERAEHYAEWSCPAGGLLALLTVDVQHDRLALTCWIIGRGEEMWLAYWGELYGQTMVEGAGAWLELEEHLARRVAHASGAQLSIEACAIDCSDGQTSDAVYAFVRKHRGRKVFAVKGAPDAIGRIEIWTPPRKIDPNNRATKAARYGVEVNIVGTAKAKDSILGYATETGRVRLQGDGPGRMHWYKGVRNDFYKQLLGEIKIPSRLNPRKREWKQRTDRRNEALDCTVYAVWLCRALGLNTRKPSWWDVKEAAVRQRSLLEPAAENAAPPSSAEGKQEVQTPVITAPSKTWIQKRPVGWMTSR